MEISSSHQMQVFGISVLAGALCGLFFDLQRVLRKKHFAGIVRANMEDFLFVAFCAFITLFVGFYFDEGAVRSYLVLGLLGGTLFYFAFLSATASRVIDFICNIISKILIAPAVKIVNNIRILLRLCAKKIRRVNHKKRAILKSVKNRVELLKKRAKML